MGLLKEFKEFAMRGNVIDMAVGVIIGGAFGKIVGSLVSDVLMPPLGYFTGGVKFTELKSTLPSVTIKVPDSANPGSWIDKVLEPATINYGNFIQAAFDFTLVAMCVFVMIKAMNALKKKQEAAPAAPPAPTAQEKLLAEIRDLLKKA